MHLKKSAAPLKVKKKVWKKSGFVVIKISVLVTWTQRKKLEFNPSYGYGAISKNVHKCAKCARIAHFCQILRIRNLDWILFFCFESVLPSRLFLLPLTLTFFQLFFWQAKIEFIQIRKYLPEGLLQTIRNYLVQGFVDLPA